MIPQQLSSNAPQFVPGLAGAGQAAFPGMMFTTMAGTQGMPAAVPMAHQLMQLQCPPGYQAMSAAPPVTQQLMTCTSARGMVQTILVPGPAAPPTSHAAAVAGATAAAQVAPHVDMTEVLAAVETLYRDELRPFGRILRKRLAERAAAMGLGAIDVDVKRLRALCESCPWLYVQSEEGGDWSALLRDLPQTFVDVYSPVDMYPAEMWRAVANYFASLGEVDMALPGGRYSCAQVLAGRRLPFLAGLSLGKVSHIVQLAISQKKLLGYLNGAVVPYARSQSMLKEQCAEQKMACKAGSRATNFATWDVLRSFLQETLRTVSPGTGSIPLSNMKRLLRSQKHVELSETALGYAKLSEALQDARVRDVCLVRLQGHGYAVFPNVPQVQRAQISIADNLPPFQGSSLDCPPAFSRATLSAEGCSSLRNRAGWVQELSMEEIGAPQASPTAVERPPSSNALAVPSSRPLSRAGNGALAFPPTPSPTSVRAGQGLPKLLGSRRPNWASGGPNGAEPWKSKDVAALTVAEEPEEQEHIADPQQLWPATPMTPPSMWSVAHGMNGNTSAPFPASALTVSGARHEWQHLSAISSIGPNGLEQAY